MEIPLESAIAVHSLEKRAQDKAEQQQLKRLVLDYEQREEQAEKQGMLAIGQARFRGADLLS